MGILYAINRYVFYLCNPSGINLSSRRTEINSTQVLPFIDWINIYLHKLEEICLWNSIFESLIACIVAHVLYFLISNIVVSALSVISLIILIIFCHYTMIERIYPRILAISNIDHEQNRSVDDYQRNLIIFRNIVIYLMKIRSDSPVFFFVLTITYFAILSYLGTLFSGVFFVYLINLCCLATPWIFNENYNLFRNEKTIEFDLYLPCDSLETSEVLDTVMVTESSVVTDFFKDEGDSSHFLLPDKFPSHEDEDELLRDDEFLFSL